MSSPKWLAAFAALSVASGCIGGAIADHEPAPGSGAGPGGASPDEPGATHRAVTPAFSLPRDQLVLLPYAVRVSKVARVLGVGTDDPLLAGFRSSRVELGDADYANGIRPDQHWTAAKLVTWVKALEPVCASAAFSARYNLPDDLPELVLAALGRRSDPEDQALVDEVLGGNATLTGTERHALTCLALLSSTEFLSR